MSDAAYAFESCWTAKCWQSTAMQVGKAFAEWSFRDFVDSCGIKFRLPPPRFNSKSSAQRKYAVLPGNFLRIRTASPHELTVLAFTIFNDLYGIDMMSTSEMANCNTRPIVPSQVHATPNGIADA